MEHLEAIVAVYADWGIGAAGTQPITLRADRRRFRELTLGSAVLVGRRTLADFPGGRPLKDRVNIVLSRSAPEIPGAVVVPSEKAALAEAAKYPRAIVIGGARVYQALLPWVDRVYVTKLDACPSSDAFFPNLDRSPEWICGEEAEEGEEEGIRYRFVTYRRAEV